MQAEQVRPVTPPGLAPGKLSPLRGSSKQAVQVPAYRPSGVILVTLPTKTRPPRYESNAAPPGLRYFRASGGGANRLGGRAGSRRDMAGSFVMISEAPEARHSNSPGREPRVKGCPPLPEAPEGRQNQKRTWRKRRLGGNSKLARLARCDGAMEIPNSEFRNPNSARAARGWTFVQARRKVVES